MTANLDDFSRMGAFASQRKAVGKKIEWRDVDAETGEEIDYSADVLIIRLPFSILEKAYEKDSKGSYLIEACVRLGDGSQKFSYEQASDLSPPLAGALTSAIFEVNPISQGAKAKN